MIRRKGISMNKSIDERLFEQLMRAPHVIRKSVMGRPEGPGPEGPGCHGHGDLHGPRGPHGPGFGPMGPHGHGAQGGHGHGPGPRHGHGPAFARERLLGVIAGYDGGVRQKTLVEELGINPSSVSEIISKLENDGYVKRTVDPEDKRATLVTLTELGEARAAEIADERKEMFKGVFGNLTDDEKEQLLVLLEKLTEKK